MKRIMESDEWNFEGANHVVRDSKDFEDYARDCVRLAEQMDSPELRGELLQQAREWMHAVIDEEDASGATDKFRRDTEDDIARWTPVVKALGLKID